MELSPNFRMQYFKTPCTNANVLYIKIILNRNILFFINLYILWWQSTLSAVLSEIGTETSRVQFRCLRWRCACWLRCDERKM